MSARLSQTGHDVGNIAEIALRCLAVGCEAVDELWQELGQARGTRLRRQPELLRNLTQRALAEDLLQLIG